MFGCIDLKGLFECGFTNEQIARQLTILQGKYKSKIHPITENDVREALEAPDRHQLVFLCSVTHPDEGDIYGVAVMTRLCLGMTVQLEFWGINERRLGLPDNAPQILLEGTLRKLKEAWPQVRLVQGVMPLQHRNIFRAEGFEDAGGILLRRQMFDRGEG